MDSEKTWKVFISLPMNGRSDEYVKERMEFIFELCKKRFYKKLVLINTLAGEDCPDGLKNPRLWYLGRSIKLLSDADIVIFDTDYKEANGCLVEYGICKLYNLPYYVLDDKID